VRGGTNGSALSPFERYLPERDIVILSFDLVKLGVQLEINAKTGESLEKTPEPLR